MTTATNMHATYIEVDMEVVGRGAWFVSGRTTGETTSNGFWVRTDGFRSKGKANPNDRLTPFAAIKEIHAGLPFKHTVTLTLTGAQLKDLPQRWQVVGNGGANTRESAPTPAASRLAGVNFMPTLADANRVSEVVVTQFAQSAALIREIARMQATLEGEGIADGLKELLQQDATAAYARLQAIREWTDTEVSAFLSQTTHTNGR